MIVNRIAQRASQRVQDTNELEVSVYEIIEKITVDVIQNNRELVNNITLGYTKEEVLETVIIKTINRYNFKIVGKTRKELIKEILDHVFRYGLAQKYLDIDECNGVFINGVDNVWVKIGNKMKKTDINFGTIENLTSYIYTIQAKLGGEINENTPLVKFEDPEQKLRIVCCIQPMAHMSPMVVFRKHGKEGFSLNDLVEMGMMTKELAEDLRRYNDAGANIIVCGKGGSGKTTLIRALLEAVNKEERILAMEEQPEWFLKHPNAIQIQVKRSKDGNNIDISSIAEQGLTMTIDRYAYGELKAGESMAYFYGAFSGNVSITSLHAGSARQAIRKAMVMMKMSGTTLSEEVLLGMLYESTNIIIFLDSFVIAEVVEIVLDESGKASYNDLWKFHVAKREATFIEGEHEKVGIIQSADMLRKLSDKQLLREEEVGEHTTSNSHTPKLHRVSSHIS